MCSPSAPSGSLKKQGCCKQLHNQSLALTGSKSCSKCSVCMSQVESVSNLWEGLWLARQAVFMDWAPDKSLAKGLRVWTQGTQSPCTMFLKKPFTQKSTSSWGSHPGTRTVYLPHMVTHIGATFAHYLLTEVQELIMSKSIRARELASSKSITSFLLAAFTQ